MKSKITVQQMVNDTVKSGVKPITFDYRDVTFYQKDVHLARTFVVINSLELGALTFGEYRFVARRTPQGEQLLKRHFERVIRLIPRLLERDPRVEYFVIPAIPKLVMNGLLINILYGAFALYPETLPSTVCVEISADILFEDIELVKLRLNELRELGVKIAVSEVGDEFCPAFKLSELTFDLLLLDKFTTERLTRPDAPRILGGMIAYLHSFGVPVIAPDLDTEEQIDAAKALECDGYSSIHAEPLFPEEQEPESIPEEPEELEEIEELEEPEEEIPEETEEEPEEIPEEITVELSEQAPEEVPAQPEEEPEAPAEPEEPEVYVTVFAGAFRRPEPGTRKGLDRTIGRTAPKRDCKRDIAKAESARKREEESKKLKRKPYVAYPALLPEWIAEEEPEEITETLTVETVEQAEEIPVQLEVIEIPEESAEPKEEIPAEPEEEIPEEIEEVIPEEPEVYTVVFAGAFRRPEQGTRKGIDRTIGRTAPKPDDKREIGRMKPTPEPDKKRRRLKREP